MQRTTGPNEDPNLFGAGKAGFEDRDLPGTPGTTVSADILNAQQEEVANAVEDSGEVLDPTSFTQLLESMRASQRALYGDGDDGDVTLPGGTTILTRDMVYNNLTIPGGVTLQPAGFRVFVREVLTLDGTIEDDGLNGQNGSAGVGGAGGLTRGDRVIAGRQAGGSGSDAGASNAVIGVGTITGLGGNGGPGGNGTPNPGAAGGTVVAPTVNNGSPRHFTNAVHAHVSGGASTLLIESGAGGGGGGSSGADAGGGGGSSAGILMIAARRVISSGRIRANGGFGGAAEAGNSGGGGGGGGGVVILIFGELKDPISAHLQEAVGGGGGAGSGSGITGTVGNVGVVIDLSM